MPEPIDPETLPRLRGHLERREPHHLDLLRQMVAINSFTANAQGVNELGDLTAAAFAELGFAARKIPCVNPDYGRHLVLTRTGGSGRKIGLISHLDTVFSPEEESRNRFVWRPEGERIYGPGTVDIKGGTVMITMILAALREVVPRAFEEITWCVLLNAAEEVAEVDFRDVCLEVLGGEALGALVFEGGYLKEKKCWTVVARKGMAIYDVTVEGRAAHAGSGHRHGANAIVQLARTLDRIAGLTDYRQDLTFNVGQVAGGTVINRVPHEARASGEMRAFSPEVYEQGLARLLALAGHDGVKSAEDGYPCRVDIEVVHKTSPWPRNEASDRLLKVWQQAAGALGLEVLPEERGGLSDGNLIWSHLPTLDGLGPAGGNAHCSERSADGHKDQEYVLVPSFLPKACLNCLGVLSLLNGG